MTTSKLFLCLTALFIAQPAKADTTEDLLLGAATLCAIGGMYGLARVSADYTVHTSAARFANECNLLTHYATYAQGGWSYHDEQQLRAHLKSSISAMHNSCREKWNITIWCDLRQGRPACYVQQRYAQFPLLNFMHDLEHTLASLRWISVLHLSSKKETLERLIEQLSYLQQLLYADHDYNKEEQAYAVLRQASTAYPVY